MDDTTKSMLFVLAGAFLFFIFITPWWIARKLGSVTIPYDSKETEKEEVMPLIEVTPEWIAAALTFCSGIDTDTLNRGVVGQVARAKLESRERIFTPDMDSALRVLGSTPPVAKGS